jgi:hypothetical protein
MLGGAVAKEASSNQMLTPGAAQRAAIAPGGPHDDPPRGGVFLKENRAAASRSIASS